MAGIAPRSPYAFGTRTFHVSIKSAFLSQLVTVLYSQCLRFAFVGVVNFNITSARVIFVKSSKFDAKPERASSRASKSLSIDGSHFA